MTKRIRYTPEQKKTMKKQAVELLGKGINQKAVAKELGTTVSTLHSVLDGESYPGQRIKMATAAGKTKIVPTNPVLQLASKRDRLAEISKAITALEDEAKRLKEEMKSMYDALGKELFGSEGQQ